MLTPIRKLKLAGAIAAAMGMAGVASTSHANVSLTVDGLGDAAIIQYFTVNTDSTGANPWQTMFRMFNNSDDAVAVKVRFREATESREILDFVVWLSPRDAWSAWTAPSAAGAAAPGIPGIQTDDTSCTTPAPRQGTQSESFGWLDNEVGGIRYAHFKESSFSPATDFPDTLVSRAANMRLKEGHIEVIGMARFPVGTPEYDASFHSKTPQGDTAPTCAGLEAYAFNPTSTVTPADFSGLDVGNVLAFNAYLMRLSTGQAVGFNPVVLANFAEDSTDGDPTANTMLAQNVTDSQKPDLDSGGDVANNLDPTVRGLQGASYVTDVDNQVILSDTWDGSLGGQYTAERLSGNGTFVTGSVDAVSATLTRTAIVNEWMRRQSTNSTVFANTFSQWVVTFPTMHYYLDNPSPQTYTSPYAYPTVVNVPSPPTAVPGGYEPFNIDNGVVTGQPFELTLWNVEEQYLTYTSPIPGNFDGLTGEVNVINWGSQTDPQTNLDLGLNSNNPVFFADTLFPEAPRFDETGNNPRARLGWARLSFVDIPLQLTNADVGLWGTTYAYWGLPVTGFGFTVYQTSVGSANGNVAMAYSHKYERDYVTPPAARP